jgi:SAM-dependent methyltransferase
MESINSYNDDILQCPVCACDLERSRDHLQCRGSSCLTLFPIQNGIPILINERSSIFSIQDFTLQRSTFFDLSSENIIKKAIKNLIPTINNNIKGKENYTRLGKLLLAHSKETHVLVLGGSILGEGIKSLISEPSIKFVETDISFGPRTSIICDAHDIPFKDGTFDAVIVQAVLEHVVDPYRCVEEIHRVLKDDGIVYAETPFMQQVHGGKYDFTRFTLLGHRRLFRKFSDLDSGPVCGPGMALAWSYQYFLLSFFNSRLLRKLVRLFAQLTSFYLKYFDYYLINKKGSIDAASGFYFFGKKNKAAISDKELLQFYKGY